MTKKISYLVNLPMKMITKEEGNCTSSSWHIIPDGICKRFFFTVKKKENKTSTIYFKLYFQGFGDILNLVPIAESVVKLNAVCMSCFGEGSFTKRKGSEKKVKSSFLSSPFSCALFNCFCRTKAHALTAKAFNLNSLSYFAKTL